QVLIHRSPACKECKSVLPAEVLPIPQITVYAVSDDGAIQWIGTPLGAIRHNVFTRAHGAPLTSQSDVRWKFEYFAGKRWLPADQVTGIGFEKSANEVVWIETPKGYSRIEYKSMTLAEKSKAFVDRIRARHVRWGMTADSHLRVPGDLSTNQ